MYVCMYACIYYIISYGALRQLKRRHTATAAAVATAEEDSGNVREEYRELLLSHASVIKEAEEQVYREDITIYTEELGTRIQ